MNTIIIGVAGGTGSGKTSLAKGILAEYGQGEVAVIEQDSYYKDLSHKLPKVRAQHNFDHPDAVDFQLMKKQITALIHGKNTGIPIYDFTTHTRKITKQRTK